MATVTQSKQEWPLAAAVVPGYRRWLVLAAGFCFISILLGLGYFALPVFYADMLSEFGWRRERLMLGPSVFSFSYMVLCPLAGKLVDRIGCKAVLLIGALLFAMGLGGFFFVHSFAAFLACNLLIGTGNALGTYVPVQVLVARWFPERTGFAIGITTVATSMGSASMPLLANALRSHWGWRAAGGILGVGSAALLVLLLVCIREPVHLSAASGTASPVPKAKLGPRFWCLSAGFAALLIGITMILQHLVIFLRGMNVSSAASAGMLSGLLAAGVVGRLAAGFVADKFSGGSVVLAATALLAIAPLALFFPSRSMLIGFVICFGLGYGGVAASMPTVIAGWYRGTNLGVPIGVLYSFASLGSSIGPVLGGRLFDSFGSYRPAFELLWVLILVTFGMLAWLFVFAEKRASENPLLQ